MIRIQKNENVKNLLSELVEEFLADKESQGRAAPTIISYQDSMKKFIKFNGDVVIEELNRIDILKYRKYLISQESLHIATINHYLRDLRTFLNYCYSIGLMQEKLKVHLLSGQEVAKDVYTEDELSKLLTCPTNEVDFVEYRMYDIVAYILATGNRAETVCSLRIGDVDLKNRIVRIATAKNKRVSEIAIDKRISNILRQYMKIWRNKAAADAYLFCNVSGEKLTVNGLRQAYAKYCKERQIEKHSLHLIRHTFAKMYILNGGSEFKLQQMLGHSSLSMTRHYVQMFGVDLARDIDVVSPLVSMSKNKCGMEKHVKSSLYINRIN